MMSGIPLADIPSLSGDFQPLDFGDDDDVLQTHDGRIPFSNLLNIPMDHRLGDAGTSIKPPWEAMEEETEPSPSHSTSTCLRLESGLDIDCREEVVSTKDLDGRSPGTCKFLSPSPRAKEASRTGNTRLTCTIPPVTPTKADLENIDPLTPTTNLKILSSVVSPEIRKQNEKKERLFNNLLEATRDDRLYQQTRGDQTETVQEQPEIVVQETAKENSRKAKSLGLLCERFLEKYQSSEGSLENSPQEISLDVLSKDLCVERRRIYDIINVLESVEMVSRMAKNRYVWHGQSNLTEVLKKLKYLGAQYGYGEQLDALRELERNKTVGVKGEFTPGVRPPHEGIPKLCEDEGKRDKSLGVMSQKFIMLFLQPANQTITLETAARILYGELSEDITDNAKFKTKVRRLYDIANVLGSLKLIRKVYVQEVRGRKPAFQWTGPNPDIAGYQPVSPLTLITSQEKKLLSHEGSRSRKRSQKGKGSRAGWGRHHSFNTMPRGVSLETKEPRSLPSSPEKQPPTPIINGSDFQNELVALCSKYPGQMHQFLTTPPAGSMSAPSTARKLLMPSPSTSLEHSPGSPMVTTRPDAAVKAEVNPTTPGLKTFYVQRYLSIIPPGAIPQLQTQGSPAPGSDVSGKGTDSPQPGGPEVKPTVINQHGTVIGNVARSRPISEVQVISRPGDVMPEADVKPNVTNQSGVVIGNVVAARPISKLRIVSAAARPGDMIVGGHMTREQGAPTVSSPSSIVVSGTTSQSIPIVSMSTTGDLQKTLILASPLPGTGQSVITQNGGGSLASCRMVSMGTDGSSVTPNGGGLASCMMISSVPKKEPSSPTLPRAPHVGSMAVIPGISKESSPGTIRSVLHRVNPKSNTIIAAPKAVKRESPGRSEEYQAVMKQLKVVHQPGGLATAGDSLSPSPVLWNSSIPSPSPGNSPPSDNSTAGNANPPHPELNIAPAVATAITNGWYDPITRTPSTSKHKKRLKCGSKRARRDKGKKVVKNGGRHPKKSRQDSNPKNPSGSEEIDVISYQLVPPTTITTPQQTSITPMYTSDSVDPVDATPPSTQNNKDASKQKRRLFKDRRSKAASDKTKAKKPRATQDRGVPSLDDGDMSPLAWLTQRDTPTPASSLKSCLGSQEFDQMLRNNVGSPLMSLFPTNSCDASPPAVLPNFVSRAPVLPTPTSLSSPLSTKQPSPMPPATSLSMLATEGCLWPISIPVSFPIMVPPDTTTGVRPPRPRSAGRRIPPNASNGYRTAFEFVLQPEKVV